MQEGRLRSSICAGIFVFISHLVFFPKSQAAPAENLPVLTLTTVPQRMTQPQGQSGDVTFEATIFELDLRQPSQISAARNWTRIVLDDALRTNPQTEVHLISAAPSATDSPSDLQSFTQGLPLGHRLSRTHYPLPETWRDQVLIPLDTELRFHEKLTVAVIRGVLNGGVTTLNLMVSRHVPALLAAPVGITVGTLCFGFAFMGTRYTDWITQTGTLRNWIGVDENSRIAQMLNRSEPILKYAFTEIAFVSVIRAVMQSLGIVHFNSPIAFGEDVISTSIPSVAGQGLWDISIGQNSQRARLEQPSLAHRIRVQTVTRLALISAFSVGAAVLQLTRLPMAKVAFGALIATGAINYLRTWHRNRDWTPPEGHPSARCLASLRR